MFTKQKGFSVIELMIVVAIIGIIASVALPFYQNYMARAKVSEAVMLLGGLKNPMLEYYNTWGRWPSVEEVNGKTGGVYTESIISGESDGLYVEATMKVNDGIVGGKQVRMEYISATLQWHCTVEGVSDPIPEQTLPTVCRS